MRVRLLLFTAAVTALTASAAAAQSDCQQVLAGKYPFVRGSGVDLPLSEFAQLFRPTGALQGLQEAAWIRGAFFQGGESPSMTLTVTASAAPAGVAASFEAAGTAINAGASQVVTWPGSSSRTSIRVVPPDGRPVVISRDGPWSLFRMLEAGGLRTNGLMASAAYLMGGQLLRYEIAVTSSSGNNPLDLAQLRQFRCPAPR